jgi:hypothetical protein
MTTELRSNAATAALEPALAAPGARLDAERGLRGRLAAGTRTPRLALAALVASGVLIVVGAAGRRTALVPPAKGGWEEWLVGPFEGAAGFLPADRIGDSVAFSALLAVMLACWVVAAAGARAAGARWVVGAIVALHGLFLLGPPLPLTDVFNYINYARLGAMHGINPYVEVPAVLPGDPSYAHATWHHLLSPYGPLFTLGSYLLVPLGMAGGYWALKAATVAASLGCLGLVWRLAQRRGRDPVRAVAFVGLNPLVLVYGVGGVHNDFFMLAAVLAGTVAVLAQRPAPAGAALVTAAALKVSAGLTLPFALAGTARRQRRALVAGAALAGAGLAAASVAAFGLHTPGLEAQSSLVTPLSPPNLLGLLLGQGGATPLVRVLVKVAVAVVLVALVRAAWRGQDWITSAGWATLALVLSLTWEMPWYVLWVLPFAALGNSMALRRAAVALSVFLALTLAPITGWLLTNACHCNPADTNTGKRNGLEIRKHLR